MAQKVSVQLVDDLDGTEAADTVTFGIDGVNYEIDLSTDNAQRLRDALSPYVASSRKVGGGSAGRRRSTGTRAAAGNGRAPSSGAGGGVDTNSVREWARSNGFEVADRGRIRGDVLAAYQAANA